MSPVPSALDAPLLVEDAIDSIEALLRERMNPALEEVWATYSTDGLKIALEQVKPNRYYTAEQTTPLEAPSVYVLAGRTEHDLDQGTNWTYQIHRINVVCLVEDLESNRLTRKCWRFARAGWKALHDQARGNVKVFVASIDYSPIFTAGDNRRFRKDTTLELRVHHLETFG